MDETIVITTQDQTAYPAWQALVRVAQAVAQEAIADGDRQRKNEQLAIEQQNAVKLGKALSYFGIDAKPTKNEYVLDGYRFSLLVLTSYNRSGDDVFREDKNGLPYFCINISAIYPEDYENPWNYDEPRYRTSKSVNCNYVGDWSDKRAEFADALDNTKAEAERLVSEADARRRWLEEHPEQNKPQPTTAERLIDLLHEIIHEETAVDAY